MKLIFITLCIVIFILFLLVLLLGLIRTIQIQNKPQQKEFLQGKVPKKMPNGFHKGTVNGIKTTWQGKRFDSLQSLGINVFRNNQKENENYPFKTYIGNGIQDKNLKVIKIDYSDNKNPWWIRYILDEMVEVSPGKYLGKVHISIIPGLPFSLGYFRLEKE